MKEVVLGLLGLGNIGGGVWDLVREFGGEVEKRTGVKTGINIKYENPRELGSDRIANAVAAYEEYGGPCIFIDFGTATTFGVVDKDGSFLGGTICPGIKLSSEALVTGTAKLPRF